MKVYYNYSNSQLCDAKGNQITNTAFNPRIPLGFTPTMDLYVFDSGTTAHDLSNVSTWKLAIDKDYNISTEPMCITFNDGIDSTDKANGYLKINIDANTVPFRTALGTNEELKCYLHLVGYNSAGKPIELIRISVYAVNVITPPDEPPAEQQSNFFNKAEILSIIANYFTKTETINKINELIAQGGGGTSGYTVMFYGNGNTGGTTPSSISKSAGSTITVPESDLVKTNYTFYGWTDGTNHYNAGETFTLNANTLLTVVWIENPEQTVWEDWTNFINWDTAYAGTNEATEKAKLHPNAGELLIDANATSIDLISNRPFRDGIYEMTCTMAEKNAGHYLFGLSLINSQDGYYHAFDQVNYTFLFNGVMADFTPVSGYSNCETPINPVTVCDYDAEFPLVMDYRIKKIGRSLKFYYKKHSDTEWTEATAISPVPDFPFDLSASLGINIGIAIGTATLANSGDKFKISSIKYTPLHIVPETFDITFDGNGNTSGSVPSKISGEGFDAFQMPDGSSLVKDIQAFWKWENAEAPNYELGVYYYIFKSLTYVAKYIPCGVAQVYEAWVSGWININWYPLISTDPIHMPSHFTVNGDGNLVPNLTVSQFRLTSKQIFADGMYTARVKFVSALTQDYVFIFGATQRTETSLFGELQVYTDTANNEVGIMENKDSGGQTVAQYNTFPVDIELGIIKEGNQVTFMYRVHGTAQWIQVPALTMIIPTGEIVNLLIEFNSMAENSGDTGKLLIYPITYTNLN